MPRTPIPRRTHAWSLPLLVILACGAPALPLGGQPLPDHHALSEVLSEVVEGSRVDYHRLHAGRDGLDRYLASLAGTDPNTLERASRSDQLAFWINAYNACMLRLVVDHYPIRRGGAGLFGALRNRVAGYPDDSPWQIRNVFTRSHCRVAGALRSQDEIEHEIIRPQFEDPRIHFAVNCAAVSCPILWPDAYVGERLDEQLDRAVVNLIASPEHFRLEMGPPTTVTLNRVLEWYIDDFGGAEGLKAFLATYLERADAERMRNPETRLRFFDYDWTLNDVPR